MFLKEALQLNILSPKGKKKAQRRTWSRKGEKSALAQTYRPSISRTHKKQHRFHSLVKSRRQRAIQRKLQIKNQTNQIKSSGITENEETSEK